MEKFLVEFLIYLHNRTIKIIIVKYGCESIFFLNEMTVKHR